MTTSFLNACFHLLASIVVLLFANSNARKWPKKSEVPPPEIDANGCECKWTPWMDNNDYEATVGDDVTYENLRKSYNFCQHPSNIRCRSKKRWQIPYRMLRVHDTTCKVETGLKCVSRPFSKVRRRKDVPHLCDDFEITVQCCHCATTAATLITTAAVTTSIVETTTETDAKSQSYPTSGDILEFKSYKIPERNKSEFEDGLPVTMILVIVFGCIIIIGFIAAMWLILSGATLHRKKQIPQQNFYQEVPAASNHLTVTAEPDELAMKRVSFSPLSGSSDYLNTSSEDEGYRSRPTYHRKRKTRSQRDRMLNGNQNSRGNTSDSLEFPTLNSRTPTDENSDEFRFRRWFPDEYERALEQKARQQPVPKTRSIFSTAFKSHKNSSSCAGDDS